MADNDDRLAEWSRERDQWLKNERDPYVIALAQSWFTAGWDSARRNVQKALTDARQDVI